MPTISVDRFKQLAVQRPVESAVPPPPRPLSAGFGSLAEYQAERPDAGFYERKLSLIVADRLRVRMIGSPLASIVEPITEHPPEFLIRALRSSWPTLGEDPIISPDRSAELVAPDRDTVPFVMAVRRLIETEQLVAARQMLAAAPTHILTDPLVARLRSILSPPVVKRVQKRDVDRTREYEWLGTDGHKYRGRWVALDGNRLLAVASSLRELREQLKTVAFTHPPLLHRVD